MQLRDYWQGNALGFDVTGFDARVIKSDERSMKDVTRERFGDEGVAILEALLK